MRGRAGPLNRRRYCRTASGLQAAPGPVAPVPHGRGLVAAMSISSAGKVAEPFMRRRRRHPRAVGAARLERGRRNSASSSRRHAAVRRADLARTRGLAPPTSAASLTEWCGARNGRRPSVEIASVARAGDPLHGVTSSRSSRDVRQGEDRATSARASSFRRRPSRSSTGCARRQCDLGSARARGVLTADLGEVVAVMSKTGARVCRGSPRPLRPREEWFAAKSVDDGSRRSCASAT